jgi:hypothetical protein
VYSERPDASTESKATAHQVGGRQWMVPSLFLSFFFGFLVLVISIISLWVVCLLYFYHFSLGFFVEQDRVEFLNKTKN